MSTIPSSELDFPFSPWLRAGAIPPIQAADDAGLDLVVRLVPVPAGTCVHVVVRGELDLATVPALRAAVAAACRADPGPARTVVVLLDLQDVAFMDSAALYALSDAAAQVAARGWAFRVTPPAGRGPRRLLLLAARRRWLPRWRACVAGPSPPDPPFRLTDHQSCALGDDLRHDDRPVEAPVSGLRRR